MGLRRTLSYYRRADVPVALEPLLFVMRLSTLSERRPHGLSKYNDRTVLIGMANTLPPDKEVNYRSFSNKLLTITSFISEASLGSLRIN